MIKHFLLLTTNSIVLGLLTASVWANPAQTGNDDADRVIGQVGEVKPEGQLKLRRKTAKSPTMAVLGMPVRSSDLLILIAPGSAYVKCNDDNTRHELEIGPQGCPCPANAPADKWRDGPVPSTRSASGTFIPVLVSPRKTYLLNPKPTVRWAPPIGATVETTYKVSIQKEGVDVWSKEVVGRTELPYPNDKEALKPGEYLVTIETGGHSSGEDRQKGLGFILLNKDQVLAFHNEEDNIRKLASDAAPTQIFLANLYANNELYAEAIEGLERLPEAAKTPTVLQMLGDLYSVVGLYEKAIVLFTEIENRYREALTTRQKSPVLAGELEGQALVKLALARTYQALGKPGVNTKLEEAMKIYDEQLGDSAAIEGIKGWLSKVPAVLRR